MTVEGKKPYYQKIIGGTQLIESNLIPKIHEHLNAEIVRGTITNIGLAVDWIKVTGVVLLSSIDKILLFLLFLGVLQKLFN